MEFSGVRTALSRGPCPRLPTLAGRYLEEYLEKIRRATELLDEEEVWWRPPGGNSVGNLILHLCGNLSLWLGEGLGGQAYDRNRAGEFAAEKTDDREQLLGKLTAVVAHCAFVLAVENEAADLERSLDVQGYETDGVGVVLHAVEHMSYHTGQIVFVAKQLRGAEHGVEFYPRHDGE
jgi:uncharacterized damage-inducible protein DinB